MVKNDRSQLLLIAGLLVATTILGSVILLNSIHSDASVNAKQDVKGMENTERTTEEVQAGIEQVFLHNTSVAEAGEPLPYANSRFDRELLRYIDQYWNLTAEGQSSLVDIQITSFDTGAIVRQNESKSTLPGGPGPSVMIADAESLPRFSMNVTTIGTSDVLDIELQPSGGGPPTSLEIGNQQIDFVDDDTGNTLWSCDLDANVNSGGEWVTLDFWNGIGEIRDSEGKACGDIQFRRPSNRFDLEFDNPAGTAEGNFTITGTAGEIDPSIQGGPDSSGLWGKAQASSSDTVRVNLEYELFYDDPSVSYTSTVTLYPEEYDD